jgi:hypothetical protein
MLDVWCVCVCYVRVETSRIIICQEEARENVVREKMRGRYSARWAGEQWEAFDTSGRGQRA